jgi:hypothetical protein
VRKSYHFYHKDECFISNSIAEVHKLKRRVGEEEEEEEEEEKGIRLSNELFKRVMLNN